MKRYLISVPAFLLCLMLLCACGAKITPSIPSYSIPEEEPSPTPAPTEAPIDPASLRLAVEDQYDPEAGYEGEDVLIGRTYHIYDDKGNNIRSIRRSADGSITSVTEMEYDAVGNCVFMTEFHQVYDKEWTAITVMYEYDEKGNITRRIVHDANCPIESVGINEEGYILGTFEFAFDSDTLYEYNEEGNVIRETRLKENGEVKDSYAVDPNAQEGFYEYDEQDRIIRITAFNNQHTVNYEKTFVYDEYGNLLREDTYDDNGDRESYLVYHYAPYTDLLTFADVEIFAESITAIPEGLDTGLDDPAVNDAPIDEAPEGDPGYVPEDSPQEGDSEMFEGIIPMAHVTNIEKLATYVSGMIEFPNFEIYQCYATPDELLSEYMLMAVWQQEKAAKGSGTSTLSAGEVEKRIFDLFGKEAYFGDYSIPSGYGLPITYDIGGFTFDLSQNYGNKCYLSYAETDGTSFTCWLDISLEGRLVSRYRMTILPSEGAYGYKVTSMIVE